MKAKFWTIEKTTDDGGIYIHDFLPVESEAKAEAEKLGPEWSTHEIELDVPVDPLIDIGHGRF